MVPRLQVISGPDEGRVFRLTDGDTFLVGRSRATGTKLMDPMASRVHCQVDVFLGEAVVSDFDSAGGTYVNGRRVTRHQLKPGDVLRVGDTELQYLNDDAVAPEPAAAPKARSPRERMLAFAGKGVSSYRIGSVLAQGQSGIVFHARDVKADAPVAFKVLNPELTQGAERKERFAQAMKTMWPLRHPNLVGLHGAGHSRGFCWMAQEYVAGDSLAEVIQRIALSGVIDWPYALRVTTHVARALDYAAGHGLAHRNITPMNVLVETRTGQAKLNDLMLGKALEAPGQGSEQPADLRGDVRYMAPERTYGSIRADGRSDIYSLGATAYALLTGRPPFDGRSLGETVAKVRQAEPERPTLFQPTLPTSFEGLVLRMLAKLPEDRPQTARELAVELELIAAGAGAKA